MKTIIDLICDDNNVFPLFRESIKHNAIVKRCEFCGEFIVGDNRLLTNDFGGDVGEINFGCSKCIERPLQELNIPDGFLDISNPAVAEAIDEYRTAIAGAERIQGRL